jgi:hypothetical protein
MSGAGEQVGGAREFDEDGRGAKEGESGAGGGLPASSPRVGRARDCSRGGGERAAEKGEFAAGLAQVVLGLRHPVAQPPLPPDRVPEAQR